MAILNFVSFVAITLIYGGDAFYGKIEAGHYFIGHHLRYTEVSRRFFEFNRIQGSSISFTHTLAIAVWIWYLSRHKDAVFHGWPFRPTS